MDINMFLKQNVKLPESEKVTVTKRIADKDGNAAEWEIRAISNTQDDMLRKKHTKQVKRGKGVYTPELDSAAYFKDVVINSLVFPDLENAELQNSWGVMGADVLLDCLLTPGEYNELLQNVQRVNGWDTSLPDLVDEVKN